MLHTFEIIHGPFLWNYPFNGGFKKGLHETAHFFVASVMEAVYWTLRPWVVAIDLWYTWYPQQPGTHRMR